MNITLESFMLEQSINEVDVMDIYVEQAQAELNVALALLSANLKDIAYQEAMITEGYVQEGELGDSVGTAVSSVRADGKKHYIKTALAAVKAFFKFLATKVGSFFKKSETDASATLTTFQQLAAKISNTAGEDCDIKIPYKKEKFIKIYQFYEKAGSQLDNICSLAVGLVDKLIAGQSDMNFDKNHNIYMNNSKSLNADYKSINSFIELCKSVDSLSKEPDLVDYHDELHKKNPSKEAKKYAKNAYKNGMAMMEENRKNADNKTPMMEDLADAPSVQAKLLVTPASEDSIFIGLKDYEQFVTVVKTVKDVWAKREKDIKESIRVLSELGLSAFGDIEKEYDKNNAKFQFYYGVNELIKKLQIAVNGMITPANNVLNAIKRWQPAAKKPTDIGVKGPSDWGSKTQEEKQAFIREKNEKKKAAEKTQTREEQEKKGFFKNLFTK